MKAQLLEVYKSKGLNGLYAYMRKHGISFTTDTREFGLHTSKKALQEKDSWLKAATGNELRLHYYSVSVTSRRTGWSYNRIRAIAIRFNSPVIELINKVYEKTVL